MIILYKLIEISITEIFSDLSFHCLRERKISSENFELENGKDLSTVIIEYDRMNVSMQ